MQGRLSPPEDGRIQCFPRMTWRDEFSRAVEAGIPAIEWIDDTYGEDTNPLRTEQGLDEIQSLMHQYGVRIPSVCADSFMEEPLIRCTPEECAERLQLLQYLLQQAKKIGARHVGVPFLDHSALQNEEEISDAAQALRSILPMLNDLDLELHLETSLHPDDFCILLHLIDDIRVRVTYDTGNSAALGYNPKEEFAAYGDFIGSVHIKDRHLGGTTVGLGTGDTQFTLVRDELNRIEFDGLITLQAARGSSGEEVAQLRSYKSFCVQHGFC